jgi:hypothetical protein
LKNHVSPKQHSSDVKVSNNTIFLKKKFDTVNIMMGGKKIPFDAFRDSDKSSLQINSDIDGINFKLNPSNNPDKTHEGSRKFKKVLIMRKAYVDKKGKLLGDSRMADIKEETNPNSRRSLGFLGYKDDISPQAKQRAQLTVDSG